MNRDDVWKKVRETPVTVAAIIFVLLFWMITPLVAQKYFNYSAINTSFAITTVYFALWKLYSWRN